MKAAAIIIAVCLVVSVPAAWCAEAPKSPDRAYVDAVLDALVGQGVLTQAQVAAIKSKGDSAAAAAAKTAATAKPAAPEAPKKKSWTDTVKVSGYR